MAFSNYFQVDKGGAGTHTTIGAAVAAATSGGVSSANPYLIDVGLGTFSENVSLPVGVHLRGRGQYASIINGTLDMKGGTTVHGFRVSPTTADANAYGVRFTLDTAGQFGVLFDVNVSVFGSNSGAVSAVEMTGSATGALLYMRSCYLYSANRYTGSNASGASMAVGIRVKSDYVMYGEAFNCHFKTSTRTGTVGGSSQPVLVLCESVGGTGVAGYAHVGGSDWEDVAGLSDATPLPLLLKSVNLTHPGALLDVGVIPGFSPRPPGIVMAYEGTIPATYARVVHSLRFNNYMAREYDGTDYEMVPIISSGDPPDPNDPGPDGAVWIQTA